MKNKNKIVAIVLIICIAIVGLTGCTEANKVSHNVSQEADNFNVIRRLVVINAITDKPMFELIGAFSFELDSTGKRIVVVVEVGENQYKKHSIGLPDVALWSVEDVSGAEVDKYKYEVNFLPEMIIPITFTNND